jgi:lipopolysaccharide biosynthesis regulator YciM
MLDRAEESFVRLREDPEHRFAALRALLRIYQTEREWLKAVDAARQLEREAGESHQVAQSHYFCELAEQDIARDALDLAQGHVDAALAVHRKSVRASMLVARLALKRGRVDEAIRAWRQIATDQVAYLPLVAQPLCDALDAAGRRDEALNLLRRSLMDHPSIDLLDIASRRVVDWEGLPQAESLLREELKKHPSLLGFERLLAVRGQIAHSGHGDPRSAARVTLDGELEVLRGLIHAQAGRLARFRCTTCGFRAREYHWLCPGCSSWDSYPPRRVEELDE